MSVAPYMSLALRNAFRDGERSAAAGHGRPECPYRDRTGDEPFDARYLPELVRRLAWLEGFEAGCREPVA